VNEAFRLLVEELRFGKKKDPFIQENPFYNTTWKDVIPSRKATAHSIAANKVNRLYIVVTHFHSLFHSLSLLFAINYHIQFYNVEWETSIGINAYIFPRNI
jgi:hypothetical protein